VNSTTIIPDRRFVFPATILIASLLAPLPAGGSASFWSPTPCRGQQTGEPIGAAEPDFAPASGSTLLVNAVVAQQPAIRYWTTNWSFRDINIGTLARRLARIGITAPVDLDGNVTVEFAVSIPINALADATAYRIVGSLSSPRLRIESTTLSLDTDVSYEDGIVSLTDLEGEFFGDAIAGAPAEAGAFQGDASLRLAGVGERLARINLAVQQVRLAVLTGAFAQDSEFRINARGAASGELRWVAPVDALTDASRWDAQGQLSVQNLSIDNRPPLDLDTGALRIAQGQVAVPNLRVNVVDLPAAGLTAEFNADFRDTQRWSARVVSQRLPVESVAAVLALGAVPATSGELTLDLAAQGALVPLDWQIEGELQSPGLSLYGVRLGELNHTLVTDASSFELTPRVDSPLRTNIRAIRADYAITPAAIDLASIDAELFGGQIEGDFRWSRDPALEHQANLDWSELDLRWDVGAVTAGIPGEVLLSTQGRLAWRVPADAVDLPAAHTLRTVLQIENLALAGQSVGNASVQVRVVDGELALRGEGALLGGTFRVDSATEIPADSDWSAWLGGRGGNPAAALGVGPEQIEPLPEPLPEPFSDPLGAVDVLDVAEPLEPGSLVTGELRLQGISLGRAGALIGRLTAGGATGRGWSGRGDAVVQFDLGSAAADGVLVTRSRVALFDFAIDRNLLTRALTIDLRTHGDQLIFDRVRGAYAGGAVELAGRWSLAAGPRQLEVRFSRVDAARALLPLTSDAIDWFAGEMSGRLRLSGTRVLRLTGSIEGSRAILFGIALGTVRSGLTGVISGGGRGWELRLPSIGSTVARGRISGHAVVSSSYSGRSFDLRSRWSAMNVDFENLISGLGGSGSLGRGNLSGDLSLDGRNIRGVADLVGRFDGALAGTEASAIPGLGLARRYLGPIGGSALTFTEGTLRGRILRGLVLIDQLALRSNQLRVAANGSIRLDNSRMNIDAVVATGDFSAQGLVVQEATRRLLLVAAPPVGLLLSLSRLVNDRIVYLRVGGTLGAPIVRVRPVETLGRNALRYFLQEVTLGTSTIAVQAMID